MKLQEKYPLFFVLLLFDKYFVYPQGKNILLIIRDTLIKAVEENEDNKKKENDQNKVSILDELLSEFDEPDIEETPLCLKFMIEPLSSKKSEKDSNKLFMTSYFFYEHRNEYYQIIDKKVLLQSFK